MTINFDKLLWLYLFKNSIINDTSVKGKQIGFLEMCVFFF